MKIKRILAAVSAAVVMGTASVTCFAVGEGEAAYCFDTADRVSDWQTYGSVDETGFKFKSTAKESKNGEGSLVVSLDLSEPVENTYGGAFIDAATVGLGDFSGCTVTMSVLLTGSAEGRCDKFALYSDGMIWLQATSADLNSKTWTDITLVIPDDVSNSKIGFTIPTFDVYKGDVLYIDDFSIIKSDGSAVANMGDHKIKTIQSESTVAGWVNIVLIVVLVLLIGVIIGGIGMLVSSGIKKFH